MNTLKMPGFTADASLYKVATYHSIGVSENNQPHHLVMLSIRFNDIDDNEPSPGTSPGTAWFSCSPTSCTCSGVADCIDLNGTNLCSGRIREDGNGGGFCLR